MSSSNSSSSQRKHRTPSSSRVSTLKLDLADSKPPVKKQKLRPLSAFPKFDLSSSQKQSSSQTSSQPTENPSSSLSQGGRQKTISLSQTKPISQSQSQHRNFLEKSISSNSGKGKEKEILSVEDENQDDRMWIDIYEPSNEEELAVHARKVQDVRQWLLEAFEGGPTGKLRKYRRILVLTGPAGSAKTATLRVLAEEMNFDMLEWRNGPDERFDTDHMDTESLNEKFSSFLTRAATCRPIFGIKPHQTSTKQSVTQGNTKRQIILLEDLPNILHPSTQTAFHSSLNTVAKHPQVVTPVVIIVSDAGLRGEIHEDEMGVGGSTGSGWKGKGREAIDVRTVLPSELLVSPYVTQIAFNPISPTLMKRALQHIISKRASSSSTQPQLSKDVLDIIIESSKGDIRSAIMALQFATTSSYNLLTVNPLKSKAKSKKKGGNDRALIEAITRREHSLALFHLLGKLLYNKRKGDAPASSISAKDAQREKDLDAKLKDPPKLPTHLKEHERRASRVDVEQLYADSPIDSSLLSLYIHQNYTQYCNDISECEGVSDWLSWVDSNGGETWYQANPHRFHLVALGTLHSLPSPVQRRNQKPYKPEFFENLKKEREAEDGIRDVQTWLSKDVNMGYNWPRDEISTELGAVLKSRDNTGSNIRPPPTHRRFSRLEFIKGVSGTTVLADDADIPVEDDDDHAAVYGNRYLEDREDVDEVESANGGGWLEEDDIEDF
ncbi:Rad17 cell cycle checkpoint protein-domain-containing protein [Abortiporus biennis]|nr:Rad17 cell cycle checkpoint protein-domain-containing protein [Abortiporus biennis]